MIEFITNNAVLIIVILAILLLALFISNVVKKKTILLLFADLKIQIEREEILSREYDGCIKSVEAFVKEYNSWHSKQIRFTYGKDGWVMSFESEDNNVVTEDEIPKCE